MRGGRRKGRRTEPRGCSGSGSGARHVRERSSKRVRVRRMPGGEHIDAHRETQGLASDISIVLLMLSIALTPPRAHGKACGAVHLILRVRVTVRSRR